MFNKERIKRIEETTERLERDLWKQKNPPKHKDRDEVYYIRKGKLHKAIIADSEITWIDFWGRKIYSWMYNLDNISQNYFNESELITKEDLKNV